MVKAINTNVSEIGMNINCYISIIKIIIITIYIYRFTHFFIRRSFAQQHTKSP